MKRLSGFVLTLLCSSFVFAQEQGIQFESGLSWEQVKSKAKQENKYIFMDCYATWCGPCKIMDKEVYPKAEVGAYANAHFINAKVQMDETAADDEAVKSWRSDAAAIAKQYEVTAFPTYLFFSPDGKLVHKIVGAYTNIPVFISGMSDALHPETQYYTMLNNYKDHVNDTAFLAKALVSAIGISDKEKIASIGDDYINAVGNNLTVSNVKIISQTTTSSKTKGFNFFLTKKNQINTVMQNKDFAQRRLANVIFKEEFAPQFQQADPIDWNKTITAVKKKYPLVDKTTITALNKSFNRSVSGDIAATLRKNDSKTEPDWAALKQTAGKRFPKYNCDQILMEKKVTYYDESKQWEKSAQTAIALVRKYGSNMEDNELNDFLWYNIFLYSSDENILKEATKWAKKVVDKGENGGYYDTYANLLYKTGATKDALAWENKAIEVAEKNNESPRTLRALKASLEKMNKQEKTWMN
jgi:thioredoxin-related protein